MTKAFIVYANIATESISIKEVNLDSIQSNENPNGWTFQELAPTCYYSDYGTFDTLEEAEKKAQEIQDSWEV